eukprot:scaffold374832_cov13-Prasinocladus_malaysianus.AAC.1
MTAVVFGGASEDGNFYDVSIRPPNSPRPGKSSKQRNAPMPLPILYTNPADNILRVNHSI